jgi:hypothetical protein
MRPPILCRKTSIRHNRGAMRAGCLQDNLRWLRCKRSCRGATAIRSDRPASCVRQRPAAFTHRPTAARRRRSISLVKQQIWQTADMAGRSRGMDSPSFASMFPSGRSEGAGRPDAGRTRGPRAARKHAAEPQVTARTTGPPCVMALRLIRTLPGDRLFCPRRRNARHEHRDLTSAPGGQDHTISPCMRTRSSACSTQAARHHAHRIPHPRS